MIGEVIAGGVGLATAADIAKWCFNAAATAERESRRDQIRTEREYRVQEARAEREHRREIERETRRALAEEAYRRRGEWLDMLTQTMERVWQVRKDTRTLIPKFTQIITTNRELLRDTPLTEQQRKAIRDCIFQIEKGIARLRSYSGPYLQGFIDEIRTAKKAALEDSFEEPELPEAFLPDEFPVVGDHLELTEQEVHRARSSGYLDLGFDQRGKVIGKPSLKDWEYGLFVSNYDGDQGLWLLSSARGQLASANRAVEARIVESVRGGLRLVWNASSREAVELFLPYALSDSKLRNAPWGTRTKVYVYDTDYRMRRVTVGVVPPESSDDAGLRLPVSVKSAETQDLLVRMAIESPVSFWRRPGLSGDPTQDVDLILRVGSGEEFAVRVDRESNLLHITEQVALRFGTVDCPLYRSAVELAVTAKARQSVDAGAISVSVFVNHVRNRLAEQEELIAVFKEEALETRKYQLLLEAELEAAKQESRLEALFDGQHSFAAQDDAERPTAVSGEIVRFLLAGEKLPGDLRSSRSRCWPMGREIPRILHCCAAGWRLWMSRVGGWIALLLESP